MPQPIFGISGIARAIAELLPVLCCPDTGDKSALMKRGEMQAPYRSRAPEDLYRDAVVVLEENGEVHL